ncbi:MAG: type II toxin-antitoxin system RelE/ParE family toxin [Gammaproteobacteria bacterium]|nr:type II toxin-antitoxin system RelE/ParE family toxin [Gammaproteobacteria bacterium]
MSDLKVPRAISWKDSSDDRHGQHSVRVNKQYRICFRWTKAGAEDVEIVDYH